MVQKINEAQTMTTKNHFSFYPACLHIIPRVSMNKIDNAKCCITTTQDAIHHKNNIMQRKGTISQSIHKN